MKMLIQRVGRGEVRVGEEVVGRIGTGLLVMVGFGKGDGDAVVPAAVERLLHYRVFADESGRMNLSQSFL